MPLEAQGQLKCVDQKTCLQLIYETEQRPETQIPTLGLVPRQTAESREQVPESSRVPVEVLNWMKLSQPCPKNKMRKSVSRIPTDEVRQHSE